MIKRKTNTRWRLKNYSLQVCLVIVFLGYEIEKLCIIVKPCLKFIGEKRSLGGLRCNEDHEVDVHSLLHWLCSGNVKNACYLCMKQWLLSMLQWLFSMLQGSKNDTSS